LERYKELRRDLKTPIFSILRIENQFQIIELENHQAAASHREISRCASHKPAAVGARYVPVEDHAATVVAAEIDPSTEGLPYDVGHQGPTTNLTILEAPVVAFATPKAILQTTREGT